MDDTIPTQMHASAVIASHHLRKSAPCQIVQEALNNHTNGPNPPKYEIMRIVTLKVDRKITPPGGVILRSKCDMSLSACLLAQRRRARIESSTTRRAEVQRRGSRRRRRGARRESSKTRRVSVVVLRTVPGKLPGPRWACCVAHPLPHQSPPRHGGSVTVRTA